MSGWRQKRKVMHRYDLTAEMYDARYKDEQEAKYEAVLRCVSIGQAAVLDVGCGTGLFFDHTAERAEMVVGVDLAKKMLLQANERSQRFGNVYVVRADADYLPFKPGYFGAVFAFTVLQNVPKPSHALLEITRAAKPGACVVVTALKKSLSRQAFEGLLESAGLHPSNIICRDPLRCYLAISFLNKNHVAGAISLGY